MTVAVSIPFFNNKQSLKRSLESLVDFPKVFCIDGRYPKWNHPSILSDDGSRELCSEFKNVELIDYPAPEPYKRTMCLQSAKDYDYCITMDSDEYVSDRSDIRRFFIECHKERKGHFFGISTILNGSRQKWSKLKHKPGEIEYHMMHTTYRIKPTGVIIMHPQHREFIPFIELSNDDVLRKVEYKQQRLEYREWLVNYEDSIRNTFKGHFLDSTYEPL